MLFISMVIGVCVYKFSISGSDMQKNLLWKYSTNFQVIRFLKVGTRMSSNILESRIFEPGRIWMFHSGRYFLECFDSCLELEVL